MNRRCFLGLTGLFASTPYAIHSASVCQPQFACGENEIYIGHHADDVLAEQIGSEIVDLLNNELSSVSVRLATAETNNILANQLENNKVKTVLINPKSVQDMVRRKNGFDRFGTVDLYTVAMVGRCALVCRSNFPDRQAWQLANALKSVSEMMPKTISVALPPHPGSVSMLSGRPVPHV